MASSSCDLNISRLAIFILSLLSTVIAFFFTFHVQIKMQYTILIASMMTTMTTTTTTHVTTSYKNVPSSCIIAKYCNQLTSYTNWKTRLTLNFLDDGKQFTPFRRSRTAWVPPSLHSYREGAICIATVF